MVLVCLILSTNALISIRRDALIENYVNQFKHGAISTMKKTGIPASITLAQGILESRSGGSFLARTANNHFGIKCHGDWTGKKIFAKDDKKRDCFRRYNSVTESFADHAEFLTGNDRYNFLFEDKSKNNDYTFWAKGLKKAGYATDPNYAKNLITLIRKHNLDAYDKLAGSRPSNRIIASPLHHRGVQAIRYNKSIPIRKVATYYHISLPKLLTYNNLLATDVVPANRPVYLDMPKNVSGKKLEAEDKLSECMDLDIHQTVELQIEPFVVNASKEKTKQKVAKKIATAPKEKKVEKAVAKMQKTSKKVIVSNKPVRHRIKKGETLFSIARRYKTSIRKIKKANGLKGSLIKHGLWLNIP